MDRYGTTAVLVSIVAVSAVGSGLGATQQAETYVVEQGENCTELDPLSSEDLSEDLSVEAFYGYTADASDRGVQYSANMPLEIEERNDDASSLFLYEGPDSLALVVLHDAVNGTGGGAATLAFDGLPADGGWVVEDDPENESVERWNRTDDGAIAVDWGWRGAYTDGGAYAWESEDDFEVRIDPAFDEDAELDPITPGNVTRWRALSADGASFEAIELDRNRSVTVRSGTCS